MRRLTLKNRFSLVVAGFGAAAALLVSGCGRSDEPVAMPVLSVSRQKNIEETSFLQTQPVGAPVEGHPWITNLTAVDLDKDGLVDLLFCDAQKNTVNWLRQTSRGQFEEIVLASDLPAPVHVAAVDFNHTGHLDLLIAVMGQVFPNNDKIGSVVILENDGHQHFTKHVILDHTYRVADVEAGDFNEDGKMDLALAQFGYDQGQVAWLENLGNWKFREHPILNLSGSINACVADFTGNHHQDIVALVSQQWEEIYLFTNDGRGNFTPKVLWGSTNEDYASSNISICDLNRDGRPDILYSNGDGFGPAPVPGPRPWHGVQWLENLGDGNFHFHRIGDLAGAYGPIGVDLDGDGKTDVVAVSAFNNWADPSSVSLMWFRNEGQENFTPHVLAHVPTHLLTVAAADLDGNGKPVLVTGGFYSDPPYDHMSRIQLWRRTK